MAGDGVWVFIGSFAVHLRANGRADDGFYKLVALTFARCILILFSVKLRVAAAQDAPVFLDRRATTERVLAWIDKAADQGVEFLAFGETFVPGYAFWLSETGGARFNDAQQKEAYRLYLEAAIRRDGPELREIASLCQARGIFAIVGVVERGDVPNDFPLLEQLPDEDWIRDGGSAIAAPTDAGSRNPLHNALAS